MDEPRPGTNGPWKLQVLDDLGEQADRAREMVHAACEALRDRDSDRARSVIAADPRIDAGASDLHDRLARLVADTAVSLDDVRFVFAALHANLHLERVADYAVTIAKMVRLTEGIPADDLVLHDLQAMGARVERILVEAMAALRERDLERARGLAALDQEVNQANRMTVLRLLDLGADAMLREWGLRMLLVSRCLERIGDHAVDIGEQVSYMATGAPAEFSDADRSPPGR